ncbi:MAG: family 1 glycosylhydrolase [Planctomycetes bacterium]|nr:family 1 glycosylhydrolase [Planctomycetota bacterium]
MDWAIDQGGTPSTSTGPNMDANPGTSTGNYAYTESSGSCSNSTAILLSPCYDISGMTDPLLLFAYHMYGADTGSINVEVSTNDCLSWNTEFSLVGEQQSGNGDAWKYAVVDLGDYTGATDLRIRFRGVTGGGFNSDMAIDDMTVFNGPIAGACCSAAGACSDGVTDADCVAAGGNPQGPLTTCATTICGGACCDPVGGCSDVASAAACAGTYQGDGTSCAADGCPAADLCADAFPIFDGVTPVDTTNAATDGPDHAAEGCQFDGQTYNDVWYTYTATCTGEVTISACQEDGGDALYDTDFVIYDGCDCNNLNFLDCNDDASNCTATGTSFASRLVNTLVQGNCYLVRIGGFVSTSSGTADVSIGCVQSPQGACCTGQSCAIDFQVTCEAHGGTYLGDNTVCGGTDCNSNGFDDACDIASGASPDCNGNNVPDECDIGPGGGSDDFDANGVPDECEEDCNNNGVVDPCDTDCSIGNCANHPSGCGGSADCQPDGVPDECQLGSAPLAGAPLFSQVVIPDDIGVGPGGLLAIGSSCPFSNSSAEDFTLADSATIGRITIEGVYFGAAPDFPGVDNNFHITFYEDNGAGNVAGVIADFPSVAPIKALHPRPPIFGTNPVYTYDFTLPAGVAVNGGQRYWLSVNGDPAGSGGPVFGWMTSNEGNAVLIPGNDQPLQTTSITCATLPALSYNPGGDVGDQDADLAFALFGSAGGGADCNGNGIPDDCDISDCPAGDLSCADCNSDGVPDGCQLDGKNDCNADGIPDDCQLDGNDCNSDGIPDDCQLVDNDCNADGLNQPCPGFPANDGDGLYLAFKQFSCNGQPAPPACVPSEGLWVTTLKFQAVGATVGSGPPSAIVLEGCLDRTRTKIADAVATGQDARGALLQPAPIAVECVAHDDCPPSHVCQDAVCLACPDVERPEPMTLLDSFGNSVVGTTNRFLSLVGDATDTLGFRVTVPYSLLDNFEWAEGFTQRFGLVEVNFETLERKMRPSGEVYGRICKNNGLGVD